MTQASLQAAFVLHHRPFRDTSVIADLLTPDFGRVSVVARGARSAKSRRLVLLQPFRPVLASWMGRSNLRTLGALEDSGMPIKLEGQALACAYYITELSLKLIPEDIANPTAFALYARTLTALSLGDNLGDNLEGSLRTFEIELLDDLGVLPDFSQCGVDGGEINEALDYHFDPESGVATRSTDALSATVPVSGRTLMAMAQREFTEPDVLLQSKKLMRRIVHIQLGGRPLKSREVFAQLHAAGSQEPSP